MAPTYLLAPETWDQVIDYLHDDLRTLSSCALVHRAWTAASRYHLFGKTTIDWYIYSSSDVSQIFPISGEGVVPYVRELRLLAAQPSKGYTSTHDLLPVSTLPHFPSLNSMALNCARLDRLTIPNWIWLTTQMRQLRTLNLFTKATVNIEIVLAIISSASSLKSLTFCSGCPFAPLTQQQMSEILRLHHPPCIERLTLSFAFIGAESDCNSEIPIRIMEWVGSHFPSEAPQIFNAGDLDEWGIPALNMCLDIVRPKIEHLSFRPDRFCGLSSLKSNIPLSGMANLRSISLEIDVNEHLESVRDMLSSIDSPHFTEVIFEMWFDDEDAAELIVASMDEQETEQSHLDVMATYFSEEDPVHPAQSATIRFVLYVESPIGAFTGVRIEKFRRYVAATFPQMQKRLRIEFEDAQKSKWFCYN